MSYQTFVRLVICLTLFLLLLACEILEPGPTPNAIATDVAGTKTAWARATAVANTLIAEAPTVARTPTAVPPTSTFTPVPPTHTPTNTPTRVPPTAASIPRTNTPTRVPIKKFPSSSLFGAVVKGWLVDDKTGQPLANVKVVLLYEQTRDCPGCDPNANALGINVDGEPKQPSANTNSQGYFEFRFDPENPYSSMNPDFDDRSTPCFLEIYSEWSYSDWNLHYVLFGVVPLEDLARCGRADAFRIGKGEMVDLGIVRVRPRQQCGSHGCHSCVTVPTTCLTQLVDSKWISQSKNCGSANGIELPCITFHASRNT